MADPFSIIAGTLGVIDVCYRFGRYLKNVQAGAAQIELEIGSLLREIGALQAVNETIKDSYQDLRNSFSPDEAQSKLIETLWRNIATNLQDCQRLVKELEELVKNIIGKEVSNERSEITKKLDGFRKQLRRESKEGDFTNLRARLQIYLSALQPMLDIIILIYNRRDHTEIKGSLNQLHLSSEKSFDEIRAEFATLRAALGPLSVLSPQTKDIFTNLEEQNEHYSVPQGVEKYYTGRSSILDDVRSALTMPLSPGQPKMQKRIVIFGLGGSGKTQFCCKYAQLYRQSYWGIFWINASSDELAKQTFQDIAKVGGVADNIRAAKFWLSNLRRQWLLIIDNADNPDVKLEDYFPEGDRGHILVTTRIPSHKEYGTVGPQSFRFQGLVDDEANVLLLKTVSLPVPGDTVTQGLVSRITEALGYLPLALLHAGKAIVKRLCTLEKYLQYHQIQKNKIRNSRDLRGFQKGNNIYMNVYSAFEINFRGLQGKGTVESEDAVQLLQMFSFFHRENIRIEFLSKAAMNPIAQQKYQAAEEEKENGKNGKGQRMSWNAIFKDVLFKVGSFVYQDRTPPVLPTFLRDGSDFEVNGDFRLRAALNELTQLSLITYNDVNESYSMHPVVHEWARERPEFSAIEQAVWCQAAATTLAQSILLPPLGSTDADERFRHELLPHIEHVRRLEREIRQRNVDNQKARRTRWFLGQPKLSRAQIGQFARFSRVYAQEGKWDEAKELQTLVKDFLQKMLGPTHPLTNVIKLALSGTLWQLTKGNEAAELQEQVLHAYTTTLGSKSPKTLKVVDVLGESRWQQGQFTNSLKLHQQAYDGMAETLGAEHEDTLKAADNLGRAHSALWRQAEARNILHKVVDGMRANSNLGPTHLNTLIAIHNLAMTYLETEGGTDSTESDLEHARGLMMEVVQVRQQKLGKEHPYTLWAIANLARVKSALGLLEEAESDLLAGLATAERNLGREHLGCLFGKLHIGDVLTRQKRYTEAEKLLEQIAEEYRHQSVAKNGEYPDRCRALAFLSRCYQLQGKMDESIEACEKAIYGLTVLGTKTHPFIIQLQLRRDELVELKAAGLTEPAPPPYEEKDREEIPEKVKDES